MDPTGQQNTYDSSSSQNIPTELFRRPSADSEGRAVKKARASKPKVKSGCITCKTRRVKCDETKPQCIRCQKFGRACDGYAPEPQQSRGLLQLQPRIPSVSSYSPSISIDETEEETRYFQVFFERMAHELSGFFAGQVTSTFWTQLLLQESQNVTSIRHAVIALGALSKSLENAPRPNLKVNVIQEIDKKHHEQAVLQHLKAIQALNQYISSSGAPQLRNALITCLLFVCFEIMLGSYASSVQQIYGGLRILQSYYIGKSGSRSLAHRRPLTIRTANYTSEAVSRAFQFQSGSPMVTHDRVIASHVEEYLESEDRNRHGNELEPPVSGARASSEPAIVFPFEGDMTSAGIDSSYFDDRPQIQRAMSMYAPDDQLGVPPSYAPSVNLQPLMQPDLTGLSIRRTSNSSIPSSAASSPSSNASPPRGRVIASSNLPPAASRKRPTSTRPPMPTPPLLQSDVNIEDILVQTFVRLDAQGLFFGMTPAIPPLIWDVNKVHHIPIPVRFQDFHTAHRCWDSLMDRALQFYRRTLFNRTFSPDSSDSPASISRQLTSWQKQLSSFEATFQPMLDSAVQSDGSVKNPAALVISLYQKCTAIMLASVPRDSEMVYDACLPDFRYIVRTCALLISSQDETQLPRNPRFSLEIGIVPPLHIVATKCRDPVIRREAVDLLFLNPRQEGMWDSVLCARMGLWIINCEEEGLLPPQLPVRSSAMPGLWSQDSITGQYGQQGSFYPSEDPGSVGYYEGGEAVGEDIAQDFRDFISGSVGVGQRSVLAIPLGAEQQIPRRSKGKGKGRASPTSPKGWAVPEGNRVQMKVVDFHIPDRFVKVTVQKALPGRDGRREERGTVISW